MPYTNLPGSYVQLQDGNLSFITRDNRQSVLVMGTATKGLTSEPFLMGDLASVVREFGATSELARAASEVKKGGANNIFLYRLPGVAPEVTHIGADVDRGTPDELGVTIRTTQASPEAAAKYGVAYRHAKNTGTVVDSVTTYHRKLTAELMVVNLETNTVVWQGTALEGATLDSGDVDVQFELGDVDPGRTIWNAQDYTTPEILKFSFNDTATSSGSLKLEISGYLVSVAVSNGDDGSDVAGAFVTAFNNINALSCFVASASGNTVSIACNGDVNTDGELVYPAEHPWAGYTARPFISADVVFVSGLEGITLGNAWTTSHGRASDIGLYPQDSNKPFAAAGGGVFIPLNKILSGVEALQSYGLNGEKYNFVSRAKYATLNFNYGSGTLMTYSAGSTGESISLMKRFEKLHSAFEDLDLAPFDYVVPYGISLNAKNATTDSLSFTADTYPTPKTALDGLGYCSIVNNGDYTYTYYWSDDGLAPKIVSDGTPAGDVTATLQYSEVNFAHLLAKYCYENSSDYKSVHGVVGTTLPDSITARGIRNYFGHAPTYAYDRETNSYYIIGSVNDGVGLLGHKFVGGKSDFNGGLKHGGFFATVDGTLDYSSSNVLLDANDKKIDIGKYISVVAIFGRTTDDINPRGPSYLLNAAAIYAGMLPQISPADSLINMTVPGLIIDYRLETKTVDAACGLGLVVAKNEVGIPVIADSPTFASPTSDYTRLTTVRIVNKIAEELRAAARPYIGKGLSAPKRSALESAISEVIKANIAGEPIQTITGGSFRIEQTAQDRVLGKMKVYVILTPVFELRQITFSVNLSAQ
ncbi:MAG: hypothetical protein EB127_00115 [Alphaproteobacteria bacterium]|nr:hypothetical protein [Alphaproteobacteria bacterium]